MNKVSGSDENRIYKEMVQQWYWRAKKSTVNKDTEKKSIQWFCQNLTTHSLFR